MMSSLSGMPEYEIPNPQVLAHAGQIADAAIFLYQHMQEINCVPSVLLEGALAIELYLKSLSSKTIFHPLEHVEGFQLTASPTRRTHLLEELFDAIDEPIREELQLAYTASPALSGVPLLRDALGPYSNLFVEVRYLFERRKGGGNSITGLINLVKFFGQVVSNMTR
jgi:hypothetical protein